jgi:hypothetical protein
VSHNLIGRPMDDQERSVIAHLLAVSFNGAAELREQLAVARVVGDWKPEGSASFDISVPGDAGTAQISDGVAPVNAYVTNEEGTYLGELILWISSGKLAGLEYAWVTDAPPSRLPQVSLIQVSPK